MATITRRTLLAGRPARARWPRRAAGRTRPASTSGRAPCAAATGRGGTSAGSSPSTEGDAGDDRRSWSCCTARAATPPTPSGSCSSTSTSAPPGSPWPRSTAATTTGTRGGPASTPARWSSRTSCPSCARDRVCREGRLPGLVDGRLRLAAAGQRARARQGFAVVAESAALWTDPGLSAPGAFDDREDFEAHDVFDRTDVLSRIPVRMDCGRSDPFVAGQQGLREGPALRRAHLRRGRPHGGLLDRATAGPSWGGCASSTTIVSRR